MNTEVVTANTESVTGKITRLTEWFRAHQPCTIATSGGIDSMLLAFVASQIDDGEFMVVHSTSAAVPSADAQRVADYARRYHWNLKIITSNEIENSDYKANPVNRCYYCKSSLFEKMTGLDAGHLVTGTNLDDLGDYRPGLIAARENNVLQPYVELEIDKRMIRQIASHFGLDDLKDLPASPCLASRIETGIAINQQDLQVVDNVETFIKQQLNTDVVRFRIRHQQHEIQLSPAVCQILDEQKKLALIDGVTRLLTPALGLLPVTVTSYQQGSAFVGVKNVGG